MFKYLTKMISNCHSRHKQFVVEILDDPMPSCDHVWSENLPLWGEQICLKCGKIRGKVI